MVARSIAFVKPASSADERIVHALRLFDSFLWAFQGSSRASWTVVVTPESADVIVVHETDADPRIAVWRAAGKRIIEFATQQPTAAPLVYPFRAARVLELLDGVDTESSVPTSESGTPHNPWQFVEALRGLQKKPDSHDWLVARNGGTAILWLRADGGRYAAEAATLQAIRHGTLEFARLALEKDVLPGTGLRPSAGAELLWFAAYHAAGTLAPWLSATTRYRVCRWPNFGLIRPLASQMRVAATLASMASRPDEIAARAKVSSHEAIRTLNALAAVDVVVAAHIEAPPVSSPRPPPVEPRGGFSSFLRNVRKHLGLGAGS
jgi:hypothetical protein